MSDIVERIDEWLAGDDSHWQEPLLRESKAEIERLRAAESHDLKVKRALRAEIERLQEMLRYIQNLPVGDELDIARRAARRALERGEP